MSGLSTSVLKDDLLHLKSRLETIESQLSGQMKEIETREQKWKSMDEKCDKIFTGQSNIIRFNVGGKKFATSEYTLKSFPNSLFTKLVESGKLDLKEEIFFDRSPLMFAHILDYMRTRVIDYKKFDKNQLSVLQDDCEYYNIVEIARTLGERLKDISFVSFESSGAYIYNSQTAGTNKIEDITDKNCLKGICANSPGSITIELNGEFEFESLDIGGWKGNSSLWSSDNGVGAEISTSVDKVNWKIVGTIPSGFGSEVKNVKLKKSSGLYIRFDKTSYLGIGYLKIHKIVDK